MCTSLCTNGRLLELLTFFYFAFFSSSSSFCFSQLVFSLSLSFLQFGIWNFIQAKKNYEQSEKKEMQFGFVLSAFRVRKCNVKSFINRRVAFIPVVDVFAVAVVVVFVFFGFDFHC